MALEILAQFLASRGHGCAVTARVWDSLFPEPVSLIPRGLMHIVKGSSNLQTPPLRNPVSVLSQGLAGSRNEDVFKEEMPLYLEKPTVFRWMERVPLKTES